MRGHGRGTPAARGVRGGPPPPPLVEAQPAPAAPGMVWVEGYWHWNGVQYVWIPATGRVRRRATFGWGRATRCIGGRHVYRAGRWESLRGGGGAEVTRAAAAGRGARVRSPLMLVAAFVLSALPADAYQPVLHEFIPPDDGEDMALALTTAEGDLPAAIETRSGVVRAPETQRPPSPERERLPRAAARQYTFRLPARSRHAAAEHGALRRSVFSLHRAVQTTARLRCGGARLHAQSS